MGFGKFGNISIVRIDCLSDKMIKIWSVIPIQIVRSKRGLGQTKKAFGYRSGQFVRFIIIRKSKGCKKPENSKVFRTPLRLRVSKTKPCSHLIVSAINRFIIVIYSN